jgi:uncharacterized membrane protein
MEDFSKVWRAFFALAIMGIAVQQFIFADMMAVIIPPKYPTWLAPRLLWTSVISIGLIAAAGCILFEFKGRMISLLLALVLFLFVLVFQIPGTQYPGHIGSWINPFKEFALAGGALVIAGSLPEDHIIPDFFKLLEKLIPFGKYMLAITLVTFGSTHFIYRDFCALLVPNWIPLHYFWSDFAGIALISGGLGIILGVFGSSWLLFNNLSKLAARLVGIMIFLWFIMLHVPRAIADPHTGNGNEWTSVFEALAFSGIAFLIARKRQTASSYLFQQATA